MAEVEIINIMWEGPLTLKAAYEKNDESRDYGVYQVYGDHPVYGLDVLFYIGETTGTFGERLNNHEQDFENWEQKIEVCLGRISIPITEEKLKQEKLKQVEKLLILACWPALNCQGIKGSSSVEEVKDLLILNWGRFRSLPGAVSGRQAGIGDLDVSPKSIT